MRLQRLPPVVHWCTVWDEYLNLPVDRDEQGRRMGECPYCGEMIWEEANSLGWKGGEFPADAEDTQNERHDPKSRTE